jgi:hypothetical protein
MGPKHDPHHHLQMPTQQTAEKCKAINVIISDEAKTLHFVGQMHKINFFTKEQVTKYEILADLDKVWEKKPSPTSQISMHCARPMAMTEQPTADSRVLPTSKKILWATASSPLRAT